MSALPPPKFQDKFVAFIDILGFKQLIEKSTRGDGTTLPEILALLEKFGKQSERENFDKYGPAICPCSALIDRNLDFRLTQISDCVIASAEVSPGGIANLVSHCTSVVVGFLLKGVMCRGYITRGPVYHTNTQVLGTGYQDAYAGEGAVVAFKRAADEKGTPFVQVDQSVIEYLANETDECVRKMCGRMIKSDGFVSAIFPFDRLTHSFSIGGFGTKFDPDKEHRANALVRENIIKLKERVQSGVDITNAKGMAKAEHYLAMLDEQLSICDSTDEFIDDMCRPFNPRRP